MTAAEIPQRIKIVNGEFVPELPEECEPHTRGPASYLGRHAWFEDMARDHVQRQCRGCGLWAIWELKPDESANLQEGAQDDDTEPEVP